MLQDVLFNIKILINKKLKMILKKIKNIFHRKFLRTPGLEFLKKNNLSLKKKEKHINFWLNKASKNKNFKNYFYNLKREPNLNLNCRFKNNNNFLDTNMLESLKQNGIVIIEDALPLHERTMIINLFHELKNFNYSNLWSEPPADKSDKSPGKALRNCGIIDISNFHVLKKYSDQATKEVYGITVKPSLEMHYLKLDQYAEETLSRGDTYLHSDRFLPNLKIFYAPFEITKEDAPFEYALGTHIIDQDYKNCFIYGKNFDETDDESKNLIKKTEKVVVKENTLYLAFTNGFHKRTAFTKKGAERFMLYLQYVKNFNKLNYLF
jgi:hypothetical protein